MIRDSGSLGVIAGNPILRTISMNGEAGCLVCSQARVLKALVPVAKGYGLKLYECASCGSTLWLVSRVFDPISIKQQHGRPRRQTPSNTMESVIRDYSFH